MSRASDPLTAEIMRLLTDNDHTQMVIEAINRMTADIQGYIVVPDLTMDIQHILNMWWRTGWYDRDGMSKFERCLRVILTKNSMRIAISILKELKLGYMALDEDDMSLALDRAASLLCFDGLTATMQAELLAEANRMIAKDGDCVLISDMKSFSWENTETGTQCNHLPHVPMRLEHIDDVDIKSVEILPDNFTHEIDWACSICTEVDADMPTCVRTTCKHVFHKGCLETYKHTYFEQEENYDKTYYPCPNCRGDVC